MQNSLKIKDWILNWDNFRKVYLFLCLIYFMPSSFDVEQYPLWICFFWGSLIIAVDFFTKREMFKSKYWYILVLMSLVYLLSTIVNYEHQLIRGAYNWVYLVTTFFIIYPINTKQSNEEVKRNMTQFNNILIYTVFVAGLISVLMFIFNIGYIIPSGATEARQGFVASRLFGIYTSPNIGAIFGFLSIVLSILNNLIKKGVWYKFNKLYIANIIIQVLFFILASSRGTELTIMVFSMFSIVFIVIPYFIQTYKSKSKVIFRTLIVFLAFFTISLGFTGILKEGLSYVPGLVQQGLEQVGIKEPEKIDGEPTSENKPVDKVIIQHSPDDAEVSSGRFTIWQAAINVVKQFPILGATDPYFYRNDVEHNTQIDESKLTTLDKNELKRAHGNMHNVYIQTLIMSGILGFIVIAIFIILHLKDNVIHLFKYKTVTVDYQITAIIFFLIIALFAEDLVESHIIFKVKDVVSIVFWYYLGLLQHFRKEKMFTDGVIEK
ncbi:MAG: O-antigen ligase family protein [Carnobacterium sp.]|uniref:O-antigen ligase family protein n=1 Tax=Carnobacterium sp. TaxID=48221 RepID=UPI00331525F6